MFATDCQASIEKLNSFESKKFGPDYIDREPWAWGDGLAFGGSAPGLFGGFTNYCDS